MTLRHLLFLSFLIWSTQASAQQIAVRSGEHDGFSRLVFMFPVGTGWNVEPRDNGFRVTTPEHAFQYDLAEVFRRIPKTRIMAITPELDESGVFISTTPNVHPQSFQLRNGAVVLDVYDGSTPDATQSAPTSPTYRLPLRDDHLDLYWRGIPRNQSPTNEPRAATEPPDIALFEPKKTDPRVAQAEAELLAQLGRAASQGLITMRLPKTSGPGNVPFLQSDSGSATAPHLALQSETVVDRDTAAQWPNTKLSDSGAVCASDSEFDLKAWLDEATSPADQIAAARRDLVGEFDRPREDAIRKLARIYVALGFGAEARALYRSFDMSANEDRGVILIAQLLDDEQAPQDDPILSMTDCDGKVALWALLARTDAPAPATTNFSAVMRSFSALPVNMRERFGPALNNRLIAMGAGDLARTARASLARAPEAHGEALEMMSADIEMSEGKTAAAETRLEKMSQESSEYAAEALIKFVESRLDNGAAVDQATIDNAGALAHELEDTATGWQLQRAQLLGLGSIGDFGAAFDVLADWPLEDFPALRKKTEDDLYALFAHVPDDTLFLTTYFGHPRAADAFPPELAIALSNRLSSLGFSEPAMEVLSTQARRSIPGRLALAQAALAGNDASAALVHLDGLDGMEAARLRGTALQLLGEHNDAMGAFEVSGDDKAALSEAWRGGDWTTIATKGSDAQRKLLELYGLSGADVADQLNSSQETAEGMLQRSNALLEQSAAERQALEKLLKDYQLN